MALISQGGVRVAVAKHGLPSLQGWKDCLLYVLGAIRLIKEELSQRNQAIAGFKEESPERFGQFRAARFASDADIAASLLQEGCQELDMRGFPAAFRSFERNENSFFHEIPLIIPDCAIILLMKRFFVCFLLLDGCAAPGRIAEEKAVAPAAAAHPAREMLVYVPLSDDACASWIKWFAKHPTLRMVIAVSPRFQRMAKDPHLKAQFLALQKEGRLEIAMQIPNAPILPLLVDSSSAREALPPAAALPNPSYAYPEDVVQLIAQTKADFFRQWNFLPRGLVLPYGAASGKLLSLLEKLGLSWTLGALEAPPVDGPYQSGPLAVWDAAPSGKPEGTLVHVWDERQVKERPLEGWIENVVQKNEIFLLPSDSGVQSAPFDSRTAWKRRTWGQPDWSAWIGNPAKNAGWDALRKTREAVERYKNSGQASVQRLDAAFDEVYGAQNSNYFISMGNTAQSPVLVEERQHEFQATLLAAYRLIGQPPPDDLFQSTAQRDAVAVRPSSTTIKAEAFPDGREHVLIRDAVGDAMGGPGAPDLVSLEVWSSSSSVAWTVTLATPTPAFVDIYVDLNGQPNVGTPFMLPGREFSTSPIDAWEYAIAIAGPTATLYRTQGMGTYAAVQTFPVVSEGANLRVTIPAEIMRGSPRRWGYQVLVMSGAATKAAVTDFIDPLEISQKDLWQDLSTGQRTDIPFVRVRSK